MSKIPKNDSHKSVESCLLIGCNNTAKNLVDNLIETGRNVIARDLESSYNTDYKENKTEETSSLFILKTSIEDGFKTIFDGQCNSITTVVVLAGKRVLDGIDDITAALLGGRITIDDVDANTLINVIKVCQCLTTRSILKNVRLIAELVEERNAQLFKDANADEVIPTDSLVESVLVKMVHNSGIVSELVMKILSGHQKAHLRKLSPEQVMDLMETRSDIRNKSYDYLLHLLIKQGIQLKSIEGVDEHLDNQIRIFLNPTDKEEVERSLKKEDQLFVLVEGNEEKV